ncbi:MAG: hypothetical protein M3130_01195 [Actinomycetota bacterium]|nr:hypothetical protein [Actinomycetota bacterium]
MEGLEIARLFKPLRDALAVAFIVSAALFRDGLIAVILYVSQEHAHHVSDAISKALKLEGTAPV